MELLPDGDDSRLVVHCVFAGGQELVLELFRTKPDVPAWIAGPVLSLSYRSGGQGADPFAFPAARKLLDRALDRFARKAADDPAFQAAVVIGDALESGVGGVDTTSPAQKPLPRWHDSLRYFTDGPLAGDAVLHAAIEVGVLRHLARVPSATLAELGSACGCEETALAVLLRALVALGLVHCVEGGAFRLEAGAAVLLDSAEPLLRFNRFVRELFQGHLVSALRAGRLPSSQMPFEGRALWEAMIGSLAFIQGRQTPFSLGDDFPPPKRLMDVGSGAGAFSADLLLRDPGLHVVAVDYSVALPTARTCYAQHGLLERVTLVDGEFYDSSWTPPEGCDAALLAGTIHVSGAHEDRRLIQKLHDALLPGGRLVVVERVIGSGGLTTAMNDVMWSFFTERGRAYGLDEIVAFVVEAGFEDVRSAMVGDAEARVSAVKRGVERNSGTAAV